jgi:hypothetical protein
MARVRYRPGDYDGERTDIDWQIWPAPSTIRSAKQIDRPLVDVRLSAAFVATHSVAIEGCTVDHVVQTNTAQGLSEFLLGE